MQNNTHKKKSGNDYCQCLLRNSSKGETAGNYVETKHRSQATAAVFSVGEALPLIGLIHYRFADG